MTSRELVIRTLEYDNPDRVPRQCWILPWAVKRYPSEAARLSTEFPDDIVPVPGIYTVPQRTSGSRYDEGFYTDEWGCRFLNIQEGLIGVPYEPLIKSWDQLDDLRLPDEMLAVDREAVKAICRSDNKFTYSNSWIRPFERYQFLRTTELAMMDIALDPPEMGMLISKIHSHYLKEADAWAATAVDAIGIMDDWGMQNGMIVSPEYFRKYYKPLYADYVNVARKHKKYVFMHSDGDITEIIPDLIEIGITAINSQLFCMDIEDLGEKYRNCITFWGEIDRQDILPNGNKEDIENAVRRVYKNLYNCGGAIAQCEFGPAAKPENIFHVFDSWNKIFKK